MARLTQDQIAQRNANLDALKKAVEEWANQEKSRLENESLFIKSVLQGRGADAVAITNLSEASVALGDEISRFLLLS